MPSVSAQTLILPDAANVEGAYQVGVTVPTPPANSAVTYTVAGGNYEVITGSFEHFVTDANPGNRLITIVYFDSNNNPIAEVVAGGTQPAATTINYSFQIGISVLSAVIPPAAIGPLPALVLQPGFKFQFSFGGGQAGDQISLLALTILRYPSDALTLRTAAASQPLTPIPLIA